MVSRNASVSEPMESGAAGDPPQRTAETTAMTDTMIAPARLATAEVTSGVKAVGLLVRHADVDTSVALATLRRVVVGNRVRAAEAFRGQPRWFNAQAGNLVHRRIRAIF